MNIFYFNHAEKVAQWIMEEHIANIKLIHYESDIK